MFLILGHPDHQTIGFPLSFFGFWITWNTNTLVFPSIFWFLGHWHQKRCLSCISLSPSWFRTAGLVPLLVRSLICHSPSLCVMGPPPKDTPAYEKYKENQNNRRRRKSLATRVARTGNDLTGALAAQASKLTKENRRDTRAEKFCPPHGGRSRHGEQFCLNQRACRTVNHETVFPCVTFESFESHLNHI